METKKNEIKKIHLNPLKLKKVKNYSQPNILHENKKEKNNSSSMSRGSKNSRYSRNLKLFNNANDYQFLFKGNKKNPLCYSDILWVKYLRNSKENPGPIQHYPPIPPSFYEQDLELYKKRFKKKKFDSNESNSNNINMSWKNLNISNEKKDNRLNEYLPHIIEKKEENIKIKNGKNDWWEDKYLHPFNYSFKEVTLVDGNKINQRYIQYDDKKTLKFPSLIFSRNKYDDKYCIKNFNYIKDYIHQTNASDFVRWQGTLRSYNDIKK